MGGEVGYLLVGEFFSVVVFLCFFCFLFGVSVLSGATSLLKQIAVDAIRQSWACVASAEPRQKHPTETCMMARNHRENSFPRTSRPYRTMCSGTLIMR